MGGQVYWERSFFGVVQRISIDQVFWVHSRIFIKRYSPCIAIELRCLYKNETSKSKARCQSRPKCRMVPPPTETVRTGLTKKKEGEVEEPGESHFRQRKVTCLKLLDRSARACLPCSRHPSVCPVPMNFSVGGVLSGGTNYDSREFRSSLIIYYYLSLSLYVCIILNFSSERDLVSPANSAPPPFEASARYAASHRFLRFLIGRRLCRGSEEPGTSR